MTFGESFQFLIFRVFWISEFWRRDYGIIIKRRDILHKLIFRTSAASGEKPWGEPH
jgi:hypothetical protein